MREPPAEAVAATHTHESRASRAGLRPAAWPVIGAAATIVVGAWAITIASAQDFQTLMMMQLEGGSPAGALTFLALTGVMMAAMMLPSALPMVEAHRGIVKLDRGARPALAESAAFALGYLAVWTAVTALALPALVALGWLQMEGGAVSYVPGAIVVAAGVYQFTKWKRFCLRHCRSPVDYISEHYRKGLAGGFSMGLIHGGFCLGCCWLLMLVWFVAGAMSLLWMGIFAALILAEKVWTRGEWLGRMIGLAAVVAGALLLVLPVGTPMA